MAAMSGVAIPFTGQDYSLCLATNWISSVAWHCGVSVTYYWQLVFQYLHITVNKIV